MSNTYKNNITVASDQELFFFLTSQKLWYFRNYWQKSNVPYLSWIQLTLVILKSKGLSEILRDIHTSTYQICRIEENNKSNNHISNAGLGGSVGCTVRLETRRSRVQPPSRSATFFRGDWSWNIFYGHSLPSADSRRAVVSFWRKNVHNTG